MISPCSILCPLDSGDADVEDFNNGNVAKTEMTKCQHKSYITDHNKIMPIFSMVKFSVKVPKAHLVSFRHIYREFGRVLNELALDLYMLHPKKEEGKIV